MVRPNLNHVPLTRVLAFLMFVAYLMSDYVARAVSSLPGIGATLRGAREGRGISIEQAAQETRISARFLDALEAERFEALPAPVYVRGFLRSYANYLRVDPNPLMAQLNASDGLPIAGPDGFVTGPGPTAGRRPPSRDPWRQRPQARGTAQGAPPPPVTSVGASPTQTADDDEPGGWAPEPLRSFEPPPPIPNASPFQPVAPTYDDDVDEQYLEDYPQDETPRSRRVQGVLVERESQYNDAGGPMRLIALAGGGLIALLFFVVVGVLLAGGGGGDDDGNNASAPLPTATASRSGSVVPVGTPSLSPSVLASPSSSASPSPSGTPGTETPVPTPGAGTPSPTVPPAATATFRPDEPTPTPTPIPPTPTPAPPTPTRIPPTPPPPPTPAIAHPTGTSECSQFGGVCARPGAGGPIYLVVCAPDGWFIDAPGNGDFSLDGGAWTRRTAGSISEAAGVCG